MVRVKGLEPPRQRRQNLNCTNIQVFQSDGSFLSQDKAETNHDSAKPAFVDLKNENPGAVATATGAKTSMEATKLLTNDTAFIAESHPIIALHWGIFA